MLLIVDITFVDSLRIRSDQYSKSLLDQAPLHTVEISPASAVEGVGQTQPQICTVKYNVVKSLVLIYWINNIPFFSFPKLSILIRVGPLLNETKCHLVSFSLLQNESKLNNI